MGLGTLTGKGRLCCRCAHNPKSKRGFGLSYLVRSRRGRGRVVVSCWGGNRGGWATYYKPVVYIHYSQYTALLVANGQRPETESRGGMGRSVRCLAVKSACSIRTRDLPCPISLPPLYYWPVLTYGSSEYKMYLHRDLQGRSDPGPCHGPRLLTYPCRGTTASWGPALCPAEEQ